MAENLPDDDGVLDGGHHAHAATTPGARQHVHPERVPHHSPRVLEQFGLGWEAIRGVNPRAILMRMPAFGLAGPWRDHVGFAQTMEQLTGLAWITGHPADQPRIPRGPCYPLAGMHAAFALLIALAERDVTGRGAHVEVPMVEVALNVAAESLIEFGAYGRLLERQGNRSPSAAPQGLYRCRDGRTGYESWLALSVATDAQWTALVGVLERPAWAEDPELATRAGRGAAHDRIDAALASWTAEHERDPLVARLLAAGIPAAPVVDSRRVSEHPTDGRARLLRDRAASGGGRAPHPDASVPLCERTALAAHVGADSGGA